MNSNYGRGSSGSLKNFDFDLGIGSNRPKSLNDQKSQTTSSSPSYFYSSSSAQPKPSWQPNNPSWSHQPAPTQTTRQPGLNGPTSMVGDIFGKSWTSSVPSVGNNSTVGVVNKDPNLFGDLVGSALGQGKSNSNVPLKSATPASNPPSKNAYSMGNLATSLPRTSDPPKTTASWASSASGAIPSANNNVNVSVGANKSSILGGPSMKSMAAGISGNGTSSNKDPFDSLVDLSKQSSTLNSGGNPNKRSSGDDMFGDFQNAPKTSAAAFPSTSSTSDGYDFMRSNASPGFDMGDFVMPAKNVGSQNQSSTQDPLGDPLNVLFSPAVSSGGSAPAAAGGAGQQPFSGVEDWDFEVPGEQVVGGSTTDLDGLPPPPAGISASTAKSKGIDNQKQGQYADAIKWLSWAVILLEKTGGNADTIEVLSCRASCYKEVGEYKKAVADCSKVLGLDESNVAVLVQRALLYESMEKYRLGADDLRTALKIDPGNRIARSTIHRLNKMAE